MDTLAELVEDTYSSDLRDDSGPLQCVARSFQTAVKATLTRSPHMQALMQDKGLFSSAEMPLENFPADALGLLRALNKGDVQDLSAETIMAAASKVEESRRAFDFLLMQSVANSTVTAAPIPAPKLLPVHAKGSAETGLAAEDFFGTNGTALMVTHIAGPDSSTPLASPISGTPTANETVARQLQVLKAEVRTLRASSQTAPREEQYAQRSESYSEVTRRGGEGGLSAEPNLSGVGPALIEGKGLEAPAGSKPTQFVDSTTNADIFRIGYEAILTKDAVHIGGLGTRAVMSISAVMLLQLLADPDTCASDVFKAEHDLFIPASMLVGFATRAC